MATQDDVRSIALSLPDTIEDSNRFAFSVLNKGKAKGIAWVWLERIHPKKSRIPNPQVVAIAVASLEEKELLLGADPAKFFTEPHYNGYRAILVRLSAVDVSELRSLITNAWACAAPAATVEKYRRAQENRQA